MKVGDKIYCHTEKQSYRYYKNFIGTWFTFGKIYTIHFVDDTCFRIIDDEGDENDIWIDDFEKHFYTEKQYRKLKLNKINESRR